MINEQLKTILGENTGLTDEHVGLLAEAVSQELLKQKVALGETHAATVNQLNEQHAAEVAAAVELANARIDECVELAVEGALKEHESKFIDADTFGRMTAAFAVIQEAFEKNGFSLDENAPLVEAKARLDESEVQYKALFEKFTSVKNELSEVSAELELAKRSIIFESLTRDLADTTKEKVGALAESVTFDSLDEFSAGVKLIVAQATLKEGADKDADADDKDADDKDADDKDGKKKDDKKPAFMKESRKALHEMTPEERMAFYRQG